MSSFVLQNTALRERILPISVEQYHRLSYAGIIEENTELIEGHILKKMTKSPEHTYTVARLFEAFVLLISSTKETDYYVRKEEPLTLGDSEPEPDLAVVAGEPGDYRDGHPKDARLVVEVAVSSLELDREKAALYANGGVQEYWIVNTKEQKVEVYTESGSEGKYESVKYYDFTSPVDSPGFELTLARLL